MSEVVKGFKVVLLGIVGYALGSLQYELEWLLTSIGLNLSVLFLIMIGVGLVWGDYAALGLGFAIHLSSGLYIFAFSCVIALMFIRNYENNRKAGYKE